MALKKPDIALTTAKNEGRSLMKTWKGFTEENAELFLAPKWLKKSWSAKDHCQAAENHQKCVLNHRACDQRPNPKFRWEEIAGSDREPALETIKNGREKDELPGCNHWEHRRKQEERKECGPISLTPSKSWRFLDAIERLCSWRLLPF